MAANTAADRAWAGLNDRQRLYLATIYNFDQAAEADIKRQSAKWMKTHLPRPHPHPTGQLRHPRGHWRRARPTTPIAD